MKNYLDFINEGKKGLTPAGNVIKTDQAGTMKSSANPTDGALEELRRKFLDKFYTKANEEDKEVINKCVSTIVYCLDKNMRIDSDIIDLLAKKVGKKSSELTKELEKDTNEFFGSQDNIYGRK